MKRYTFFLALLTTMLAYTARPSVDLYWLETALDSAEATLNAESKITIYTNILATVSSNDLSSFYYDGAPALFTPWAGLSWAYLHKANTNLYIMIFL